MSDLIIIGAGPYGVSLAAHAAARRLSYVLLGRPLDFWKNQIPQSMFIRTNPQYISLSDAEDKYTIQAYSAETGIELQSPFPRPAFVDYAHWFAERNRVRFTPELAEHVETTADPAGYRVKTESGRQYASRHVIIATGLQHYHYMPDVFAALPRHLVSHTFGQTDFSGFSGKRVAVIGSGQSAWETAALLHRAGADAELIYRRETVNYTGEDNLASGKQLIESAQSFYLQPLERKLERWRTRRQGSVAYFLRPLVDGIVPETSGVTVVSASSESGGQQVGLSLSNGDKRLCDHVIAATGYRIDVDRVPFLAPALLRALRRADHGFTQFPWLSASFESSSPGLFFAGPLASHTHGGAYGFIAGVRQACVSIVPEIARRR